MNIIIVGDTINMKCRCGFLFVRYKEAVLPDQLGARSLSADSNQEGPRGRLLLCTYMYNKSVP